MIYKAAAMLFAGGSASQGVVLVVDDNVKNIQVVGTILTQEGFEVIPATSGAQALQRMEARPPDLVLLDVLMPDMDGFEVCRRLRDNPETSSLPVIFVSAANDADAIVRGLEAGGVDYITKPFNKTELLARVRSQVEIKRTREVSTRILQEREKIISMVAHDLKNPLGAIRFSAQTLAELRPDQKETADELIQHIVTTCDQVVSFVDHFLNRRAQEAAQERLVPVRITTDQIRDMISAWQKTAQRKQITLKVTAPKTPENIRGDLLSLGQILDNLMSNAVKFSHQGGHIVVELVLVDGRVVITIADEGPGFTESDQARMFQDYMRLSARPTGGESSTGLGLAIAKRGADRMGAGLRIDNRSEGCGAVARLELSLWSDDQL